MTEVLIISDSHGLTTEVTEIKQRHQLKHMIHCGDSELDMDAKELEGFLKVAGNCDFDARLPKEQTIKIDDLTYFVTHGHLYKVKSNLMTLVYRAAEVKAHVICFGHTHIAGAEKIGNQLFINPGSIRMPKKRSEKSYAILDYTGSGKVKVIFYSLKGEIIEALSYKTYI